MSDHIHEQISTFLDDELSSEESAFLVRRLTSDPLAHQQTVRYATIGSILREESLLANSSILRDRIHAVLDGAPVPRGFGRAQSRRQSRWARFVTAAGVAAGVAIFSLVGLRAINNPDADPVSAANVVPGVWTEPSSYVVPGESTTVTPIVTPPIWLTNYMMQHGSHTPMLRRTSVHSNLIGIHEPDVEAQPETEVEAP